MIRSCLIVLALGLVAFSAAETVAQTGTNTKTTMTNTTKTERKPFEALTKLESDADSISYALGVNVGQGLLSQFIEVPDIRAFATGLQDALIAAQRNGSLKMSDQALQEVLMRIQNQMMYRQQERLNQLQEENLALANAFLEDNKGKDGVITTPSGLQYKIIKQGEGESPTTASTVTVHYIGTLLDGSEFDSSRRRGQPASFPVTGVIDGWTEGLQLMKPGAIFEFYIPPHLGYGEQGNQRIAPNSLLIFEVELLEFKN
jgi:FKBP-type peptidyl-prolyl cis-trans isomerase FklB